MDSLPQTQFQKDTPKRQPGSKAARSKLLIGYQLLESLTGHAQSPPVSLGRLHSGPPAKRKCVPESGLLGTTVWSTLVLYMQWVRIASGPERGGGGVSTEPNKRAGDVGEPVTPRLLRHSRQRAV